MDPADAFGLSPTVEEVEAWFLGLGYERHVVGKSVMGRELVAFSKRFVDDTPSTAPSTTSSSTTIHVPTRSLAEAAVAAAAAATDDDASTTTSHSSHNDGSHRSVLFQSLVHGNEPLGLLALLHTAAALSYGSSLHRVKTLLDTSHDVNSLELVFFPIVNVDAFQLNLDALKQKGQFGCRRTNMRVSTRCAV